MRASGGTIRRGGITKTGNHQARRRPIEAAWSYQYSARIAKEKAEMLVRLPKNIRDIAWEAQTKLCKRCRSMIVRGKKPTVVAAIAREPAGFIWAIGRDTRSCGNQPAYGSLSDSRHMEEFSLLPLIPSIKRESNMRKVMSCLISSPNYVDRLR
jgi:hypothetical protein